MTDHFIIRYLNIIGQVKFKKYATEPFHLEVRNFSAMAMATEHTARITICFKQ